MFAVYHDDLISSNSTTGSPDTSRKAGGAGSSAPAMDGMGNATTSLDSPVKAAAMLAVAPALLTAASAPPMQPTSLAEAAEADAEAVGAEVEADEAADVDAVVTLRKIFKHAPRHKQHGQHGHHGHGHDAHKHKHEVRPIAARPARLNFRLLIESCNMFYVTCLLPSRRPAGWAIGSFFPLRCCLMPKSHPPRISPRRKYICIRRFVASSTEMPTRTDISKASMYKLN